MKTAGQILKKARQEKGISLSEVEKATRIRPPHLKALENDQYEKLPSITSAKGFIKNYAEFLGLSSSSVLAVFRRDFDQDKKGRMMPPVTLRPIDKSIFSWTPRLTLVLLATTFFTFLIAYLAYQYFSLIGPPKLLLDAPLSEEKVKGEIIEVVGRVDPDAAVTLNGALVHLSEEGEFRYHLSVSPGKNTIVVEAVSKRGKKSKITRTIYVIE